MPALKVLNRLTKTARQGFTLAEMVIVIAVLAILVTISTPAIFEFMRQRDKQAEENVLMELRKALQAYIADKNALPGTATWATDLSGYTNLSLNEIRNDTWGVPRAFIAYQDNTRTIQGTRVPVFYVTLHSAGPNRQAQAATGIAVNGTAFAGATDAAWWANIASQQVTTFSALAAAGDDQLIRFTDYPEKLERYNLTIQRMDRITTALESYAKNGYANKVTACGNLAKDPTTGLTGDATCDNGMPERIVYYPRSQAIAAATDNAMYLNSTLYVDNAQSEANRRIAMQGLMRLLGLPDDFCCSAITLAADGQPAPMFYFSNPRPRNPGGGCAARPGLTDMKLPARLTTTNDDTASTPTCG